MKTTTRVYDVIYSTYNRLYNDFKRDNQIVYFNKELQFSHKVIDYDEEIKTVCRNTIFYGLDFLDDARDDFEKEFLSRFLTRTIKFQTYEVLNWHLVSFTLGIKNIIKEYYLNNQKYLNGTKTSKSSGTHRNNSIDVDLPQDQVNMSLNTDEFEYATNTNHAKASDSTTNSSNDYDVKRLEELRLIHDNIFKDLDKQLFSYIR